MEIIIFPVVTRENRGKPKKYSKFQNTFFLPDKNVFAIFFFYSRNLFPIKHDNITLSQPTFPVTRGWKTNCTPFAERIRVRANQNWLFPRNTGSYGLSSTGPHYHVSNTKSVWNELKRWEPQHREPKWSYSLSEQTLFGILKQESVDCINNCSRFRKFISE